MSEVLPIQPDDRYRASTATAGQTAFTVPFPFQDNDDIVVIRTRAGVASTLAEGADYTLTGANDPSGGTVTLTAGALEGDLIERVGEAVLSRLTSIVQDGRYRSAQSDRELDRNRIIQQEQARDIARSFKSAYGKVGGTIAVGIPDTVPMWDENGNLGPGPSAADIDTASEASQAALAAQAAAEAARDEAVAAVPPSQVADVAALQALRPAGLTLAYMTHSRRRGYWKSASYADNAALVDADVHGIIACRSTADATKCWLRLGAGPSDLQIDWARDDPDPVNEVSGAAGIAYAFARCRDLAVALGLAGNMTASGATVRAPAGFNDWEGGEAEDTPVYTASGINFEGVQGSTVLSPVPTIGVCAALAVPSLTSDGNYHYANIRIAGITWDSSRRPFQKWLSKADGTPITDPAADYVMGSGALASGISGVSLTAQSPAGTITGVTINNGGSGWNGHPTHPYQPNTVRLKFSGGFPIRPAIGYATISGGTLTSVTIEDPGLGYLDLPTVTTCGGYADPALLLDPSVDRRNALGYTQNKDGLFAFNQCNGLIIEDCSFLNGAVVINAQGSRSIRVRQNRFDNCGKEDGVFPVLWLTDLVVATKPTTLAEDVQVIGNVSTNTKRHFLTLGHGIGCMAVVRDNIIEGATFLGLFGSAAHRIGRTVIERNICSNVPYCTYTAQMAELDYITGLVIKGNKFSNGADVALQLFGCIDVEICGNEYDNICEDFSRQTDFLTSHPDGYSTFSPETEGYSGAELSGAMPKVFFRNPATYNAAIRFTTIATTGSHFVTLEGDTILDDRAAASGAPAYLALTRTGTGSANVPTNYEIERVRRLKLDGSTVNTDIALIAAATLSSNADYMDAAMTMRTHDNPGHASAGSVTQVRTVNATGSFTQTCGFPPKRVEIWTVGGGSGTLSCRATLSAKPSAAGGAEVICQVGTTVLTDKIARLVDTSVTVFEANFTAWKMDGFTFTVTTATQGAELHFVCYP